MKANLKPGGELIEPRSHEQAHKRIKQIRCELQRIDKQLADSMRPLRPENRESYETWRQRAFDAKRTFEREELLLQLWLANTMIKEMFLFIVDLKKDEVEFTAKDDLLYENINNYLNINIKE